ncbi:restriction endonuclease [Komagataeibacter sp. FNDCF1]|uniref:restriction endonuclease n=1 Tax=Komagataeibacter sp. FNDCF1 TaxID=2878681 RepID=UPI001E60B307|nr:restriction endonuclease [Komagataeibacter sp. FNDCF1]MCE2565094.1 restriction endonuclease [Komagataeibacter sp. FNDCF1]
MRAWIMPWLWGWLLLASVPAVAAPDLYRLAPATAGCTQPDAAHRLARLPVTAGTTTMRDHALALLHCQRAGRERTWQQAGRHDDLLLLRPLSAQHGVGALYFPASAVTRVGGGLPSGLLRLVMVGIGAVLAWPVLRHGWRFWRRRMAWCVCRRLIGRHAEALRIRRRQLVQVNSYGVEQTGKWQREMAEFSRTVLQPALRARGLHWAWPIVERAVLARIERVAARPATGAVNTGYAPDMDPIAYERYCAGCLRACGWDAQATPPGGDQGADVIARRDGLRLVVQCKLYRSAVGNEAVQQVSAARLHYQADVAAVVSNADYTSAARQLARSNNVFLLHHDELAAFADRLNRMRKKG